MQNPRQRSLGTRRPTSFPVQGRIAARGTSWVVGIPKKSVKICMVSLRKSNVVECMLYIWPYSTYNVESYIETTYNSINDLVLQSQHTCILLCLLCLIFRLHYCTTVFWKSDDRTLHACHLMECAAFVQHRFLGRNFYGHWLGHDFHQVVWEKLSRLWYAEVLRDQRLSKTWSLW